MYKKTIILASALAAILTVTALTTVWTTRALADQVAGNGGIGGAGGAGGAAGNGGENVNTQSTTLAGSNHNHQSANGGDANGGNGGSANGGNICNHVKAIRAGVGGEQCGSS